MPKPIFFIEADGKDVTQNFDGILMSMTVTDGEGLKSDTLEIQLDDLEGTVKAPRTGAVLKAKGGYEGRIRDFGLFVVDSVSFSGWPQTISISAKSVEAKSIAKQREPKSYGKQDFPTYGAIFQDIAGKVGLPLAMSAELKSLPNPFEAQTEEDGLEFLTRIGSKINASVSVKSKRLVVVAKGKGQSASGAPLDTITVAKGINLLSYQASLKDEPKHSEVEATYYDRAENARKTVKEKTGMDGPKFLIRPPLQSEVDAKHAAKSKSNELKRAQGEATFQIDGEPFAQPEAFAVVSGCRPGVDGSWRVVTVTHNFSATSPYTTSLQCETPPE